MSCRALQVPATACQRRPPKRSPRWASRTDTSGLKTYATLPEASWPTIEIAVETVTEDLALKQKLFAEMEKLARPDCALTSNSSSFPISEIGKGLKHRRHA